MVNLPKKKEPVSVVNTAGIDIGKLSHFVAVPEDRDKEYVKEFNCFTSDLQKMIHWLHQCKINTVVMEPTNSDWIPVFEILDRAGFEVMLVGAHQLKNVRGRKSDVIHCQWLQQLHTYGLLGNAFIPEDKIVELRRYLRQRSMLIESAAMQIKHMQKALIKMNLHLNNVTSDITGVTGMRIIQAILNGEMDPDKLTNMRNERCKNSEDIVNKSLEGIYRDDYLFLLKQAFDAYEFYQAQVEECDQEIKKTIST